MEWAGLGWAGSVRDATMAGGDFWGGGGSSVMLSRERFWEDIRLPGRKGVRYWIEFFLYLSLSFFPFSLSHALDRFPPQKRLEKLERSSSRKIRVDFLTSPPIRYAQSVAADSSRVFLPRVYLEALLPYYLAYSMET